MDNQISPVTEELYSHIIFTSRKDVLPMEGDLFVLDSNTALLFADRDPEKSLVLPSGESAKNWASLERIFNRAHSISLGRDGVVVGIGGGVVTDVTALAASMYMRGCRLILVPTTLLGMVDASIGGKTGIDFCGIKNLLGTFYPAHQIRICISLLESLPEREYLSGLAEIIKHAMLTPGGDGGIWDILVEKHEAILSRDESILEQIIREALQIKLDIVRQDLKESGIRAHLNLGHTFAHALESATNFSRWSHGEAVAWGLLKALELGERLSVTDPQWANDCRKLIKRYGLEILTSQISSKILKEAMYSDKKKRNGILQFVLSKGAGQTIIQSVPERDLDAVLA